MIISSDKETGLFSITELSFEDVVELSNAIDTCPLPQKRQFYNLKKNLDHVIMSSNTQAKKK